MKILKKLNIIEEKIKNFSLEKELNKVKRKNCIVPKEQDITESSWGYFILESFKDMELINEAKDSKKPYGDVEYADTGFQKDKVHRYPIDTKEHVRAAARYIGMDRNKGKYSSADLATINNRIRSAEKKFGIAEEMGNYSPHKLDLTNLNKKKELLNRQRKELGLGSVDKARKENREQKKNTVEKIRQLKNSGKLSKDNIIEALKDDEKEKKQSPPKIRDLKQKIEEIKKGEGAISELEDILKEKK